MLPPDEAIVQTKLDVTENMRKALNKIPSWQYTDRTWETEIIVQSCAIIMC